MENILKTIDASDRIVVAGLDLSLTNSGVAVITGRCEAEYFSLGYGLTKASERDRQDRICYIANQVMGFLKKFAPFTAIGVEDYAFSQLGKLTMLAELCGVIKNQCYLLGTVPLVIPPNSVRKEVVGMAKADKEQVKIHLEKKLGYPPVSDLDQSDALAVAEVCWRWANGSLANSDLHDRLYRQQRVRRKTK